MPQTAELRRECGLGACGSESRWVFPPCAALGCVLQADITHACIHKGQCLREECHAQSVTTQVAYRKLRLRDACPGAAPAARLQTPAPPLAHTWHVERPPWVHPDKMPERHRPQHIGQSKAGSVVHTSSPGTQ